MISREQFERDMAEFRAAMKPEPLRKVVELPPCHGSTDETGVTPEMRAMTRAGER